MSTSPPPLPPHEAPVPALRPAPAPRHAIALVLALSFALLLFYVGAAVLAGALAPGSARAQVVLAQVIGLLLPGLALVVALRRRGLPTGPAAPPRATVPRHLPAVLGAALCGSVLAQAGHALWAAWLHGRGWAWVAWAERQAVEAYGPLLRVDRPADVVAIVLVATLVPAACEELVFRRLLQGVLSASLRGGAAVAIAALIFATFHVDPIGLPGRFLIGLSIGLVYHRTGSLVAAGLLHAVHNVIAVSVVLGAADGLDPAQADRLPFLAGAVVAGVGVLALAGWLLALAALPPRAPAAGDPPRTGSEQGSPEPSLAPPGAGAS